jgi:hypothetical protein
MAAINPDVSDFGQLDSDYIAYTNAPTLLIQHGALLGATALVIILRCYVRVAIIKTVGKDDWIILLAFAFSTATFIIYALHTKVGAGKHFEVIQMDEQNYREFLRLRQVQSILVGIGVGLVKISIACFMLRIVSKLAYRWFLYGFNIFMILFTTACIGTLGTWDETRSKKLLY